MPDERTGGEREQEVRAGERGRSHADAPVVDLGEAAGEARADERWDRAGHAARTIVEHDELRLVLVALRAGARVGQHVSPAPIVIQCLTGRVRVRVPERDVELRAGQLLALPTATPHDVEALEESSFLLNIAARERGEPPAVH